MRFNTDASTGPTFPARFSIAFANLLVALAPFFATFLAPIIIVVMIPATDIATADIPAIFSFAHFLNLSNLVRSFVYTSSSTMDMAFGPFGRSFDLNFISSAFNSTMSAIASYRRAFCSRPAVR